MEISGDNVRLAFDEKTVTFNVELGNGLCRFGPLATRVRVRDARGGLFCPVSTIVKGWESEETEVATPLGNFPGVEARLIGAPGLPFNMTWRVALAEGGRVLACLSVENKSDAALKVFEMAPLAYRGADPGLDMGAGYTGWRFYRTGYQSWTPAGSIGVMEEDHKPRFFLPSRTGTNPLTPYTRKPGEKVSDWMGQVVDPRLGLGALLGFIGGASMSGRVEFEVKYDRFRRLEGICDGEGMTLAAGKTVESEWLLLSLSDDALAQQEDYFNALGKAMKARPSEPVGGWCTWYFSFWNITEHTLDKNLEALSDGWRGQVELFQLDDGFQKCLGQWTDWNEKFPTPPGALSEKIASAGFKPGLWLAPFLVSRTSPIYRDHRDWLVRNEKGRPLINFIHPAWDGHVMHALDATHPGAQKWLRETFNIIANEYGFKYLKLDFLYAAATPGVRRDRSSTGTAALRKGLEIIREASGDDAYILGCGCPLGPAVGIADAMRVSQDVDIRWSIPLLDLVSGVPTGPGAGNCIKNNLARLAMHGRLWANDPDCVVMREALGGMKPHEIQSQLTAFYLTGGAALLSEDMREVLPERLEWFRSMLPPSNKAARALDLFDKDSPELLFLKEHDDSALVAVFNWSGGERELDLDLGALGLEGAWRGFDFWGRRPLGAMAGKASLGKVPSHGHVYLRLVKSDGTPRLLGTDLHMGMGEHFTESAAEAGGVKFSMSLPGPRKGRVWAALPGGKTVVKEVEFTDGFEDTLGE